VGRNRPRSPDQAPRRRRALTRWGELPTRVHQVRRDGYVTGVAKWVHLFRNRRRRARRGRPVVTFSPVGLSRCSCDRPARAPQRREAVPRWLTRVTRGQTHGRMEWEQVGTRSLRPLALSSAHSLARGRLISRRNHEPDATRTRRHRTRGPGTS
jgi:hypothetical protein